MEDDPSGTRQFYSAGATSDPWRALPEQRWRAAMRWVGNNQPPILEQKWYHIHTQEIIWRVVPTVLIDMPDEASDKASDGPSMSTSQTVPAIMADLARMRQAIEEIRPHADAWIGLLEAYLHSLSETRSESIPIQHRYAYRYAECELLAMKRELVTLLSL